MAVQVAGGLIGQEDGGILGQCPGYLDLLLLASRELHRAVLRSVGEPHPFKRLHRASPCIAAIAVEQRQLHVGQRGEPGQQVVGLENEPDLAVTNLGQVVVAQLAHVLILQHVSSGSRHVQASDDAHKRGLAGTGWAHDGCHFALLDGEADALKDGHLHTLYAIDLCEVLKLDHGFIHNSYGCPCPPLPTPPPPPRPPPPPKPPPFSRRKTFPAAANWLAAASVD